MRLHPFICVLLLLVLSGGVAFAQQDFTGCFIASVGVPYNCDLGQLFGLNELASIIASQDGIDFTFAFALSSGGSLSGFNLSQDGVLSGTPTVTGSMDVNLQLTEKIVVQGQTLLDQTFPFPFSIFVEGATQGKTIADPLGLTFTFNHGDTAAASQSIAISNRRNESVTITAHASTSSGANWLSVTPASGTAGPFGVASELVTVNPSGLASGVFEGSVSIAVAPTGETFNIPVIITVAGSQQGIKLSQSGLRFRAVQDGGAPPSQTISVLNQGKGAVNFSATAVTLTGGGWLSVSPASGSSSSSSSGSVAVSVNAAGLAPGNYYGAVSVVSEGADNTKLTAAVVLNVFTAANNPGPSLSTTGLIFVAQAGGQNPAPQTVMATNPSPNPLTLATTPFFDTGAPFFTVQPQSGTVQGAPFPIVVQPTTTGLAAGVYTGQLALTFVDPATKPQALAFPFRVQVVLIVIPSAGSTAGGLTAAPAATGCTPTKLIPVFTQLGSGFQVSAGWPTPVSATVVDDCGTFMTTGSVAATFSSGDPALPLTPLTNGQWTATWNPQGTTASQVTITVQAQETQPALQGTAQIGGSEQPNPSVPIVSAGGIVSAASNTAYQPIGPGSYISIYGSGLSQGTHQSQSLPLSTNLGGTQAFLGGKILPLNFTSTGQINAIVPFDIQANTTQQLLVQQNGAISVPQPVVLSAAQPAIFTQDQSGTGPGVIVGYKANGSANFLINASHPVSPGDTLVIYCTGLGPVDQPVAAGSAGPSSPLAHTVNPVTVTVGGKNAPVAFAGLAPGLAVYQVNVVVPSGVKSGNSVPVVLSIAGLQSVPVTIAVK